MARTNPQAINRTVFGGIKCLFPQVRVQPYSGMFSTVSTRMYRMTKTTGTTVRKYERNSLVTTRNFLSRGDPLGVVCRVGWLSLWLVRIGHAGKSSFLPRSRNHSDPFLVGFSLYLRKTLWSFPDSSRRR